MNFSLKIRHLLVLTLLFIGAIGIYFFLFAKSSFAYKAAIPALFSSKEVHVFLGEPPERSLLVGVSQFLSTRSCAEITFYVRGTEHGGFVQVRLAQEPGKPWQAYEVVPGWFTDAKRSCRSPGVA